MWTTFEVFVNLLQYCFCFFCFFFLKRTYILLFIYFWLCWVFVSVRGLSPVAASGGHSSLRCAGLSLSRPLLLRPLLLRSTGSRRAGSAVVAHGPSCSAACGIFPDHGLNSCPLHWQADSQPLRHQGSPAFVLCFGFFFWPQGMWDLSSPIRDRTRTPCIGRRCLNHRTTREVPVLFLMGCELKIFFLLLQTISEDICIVGCGDVKILLFILATPIIFSHPKHGYLPPTKPKLKRSVLYYFLK